jgi:hypothetical protein
MRRDDLERSPRSTTRRSCRLVSYLLGLLSLTLAQPAAAWPAIPDGWQASGDLQRFEPDRLWEYINGADALFLDYGCQELLVQDLARGDLAATVSVYDHGTALNAFGIFQREQSGGGQPLDGIGGAALLQPPYSALLVKDRFYLKLDATSGDLDPGTLAAMLTDLAAALPGKDGLPPELSHLPTEGQTPGTAAFTRRDFLGLVELRDCVHASYQDQDGGSGYQLFSFRPDARFFNDPGSRWQVEDGGGERWFWRAVPYRGLVVLRGTDTLLLGIADLDDLADARARLARLPLPGSGS